MGLKDLIQASSGSVLVFVDQSTEDVCSAYLLECSGPVSRDQGRRASILGPRGCGASVRNPCGDWHFYGGTRGRLSPSRRQLASCTQADMQIVCSRRTARVAIFIPGRPFAHDGYPFCGSMSGQLGDDRSECIGGVGADDKIGEAALLPSSQEFLDGGRRVTWKYR